MAKIRLDLHCIGSGKIEEREFELNIATDNEGWLLKALTTRKLQKWCKENADGYELCNIDIIDGAFRWVYPVYDEEVK